MNLAFATAFLACALAACADAETDAQTDDVTQACKQPDAEPNHVAAHAQKLSSSNDCDDHGARVEGVLAGTRDTDWYLFEGYDAGYCRVDPAVTLEADVDARVCMFFACVEGATDIECPDDTQRTKSAEGLIGCCGAGAFTVSSIDCDDTIADDVDVYIRVDRGTANACSSYALSYSY